MSFDDDPFDPFCLDDLVKPPSGHNSKRGPEKDDDRTVSSAASAASGDSSGWTANFRVASGSRGGDRASPHPEKMGRDDGHLSRTLDEAFGTGPPPCTKNGRPQQQKSPSGEKSVGSQGSRSRGGGQQERGSHAAVRQGMTRQNSQRRASAAEGIYHVEHDDDHPRAAKEQRRPRRTSHQDRLHAVSMESIADGIINLGYCRDTGDDSLNNSHNDRQGRHPKSRNQIHDLGYDDQDEGSYGELADDVSNQGRKSGRARRAPRRPSNDGVPMPRRPSNNGGPTGEARRTRAPIRNASKSFDETTSNARPRGGRRRASVVGGSSTGGGSAGVDAEITPSRARRLRRASVAGTADQVDTMTEALRVVRDNNRSGDGLRPRRNEGPAFSRQGTKGEGGSNAPSLRRKTEVGLGAAGSAAFSRQGTKGEGGINAPSLRRKKEVGLGASEPVSLNNPENEQERQEWQEKRADKQKAMLAKLKNLKTAPPTADEASLPDDLVKSEEPQKSKRRASLGIPKSFGLSSTNFASFDEDDKKVDAKTKSAEKPEIRKSVPVRHKSIESAPHAPPTGGRARATDTDRRRRGSMLDRIGA